MAEYKIYKVGMLGMVSMHLVTKDKQEFANGSYKYITACIKADIKDGDVVKEYKNGYFANVDMEVSHD